MIFKGNIESNNKPPTMKLLSLLATAALFLFGQSTNLCGVSSQTVSVSAPMSESSALGQSIYIYNSASQSIVSPVEFTNELVMVPWQQYNNTMQWNFELDGAGPSVYISSMLTGQDGCDSTTNAVWDAPKGSPVTTTCNSGVNQYTNFILVPVLGTNTYVILPASNFAACVTIVNNAPVIPSAPCNRFASNVQWQFVTIS